MEGFCERIIITSSVEGVHPLPLMVHLNALVPIPIPVTPEVGEEGEVIVAVPEITVQSPVPSAGVFPESVVEEEQIF